MSNLVWWIGAAHVVAYSIAGSVLLFGKLIDWTVAALGIQRDILKMYGRYLREKREKGRLGA